MRYYYYHIDKDLTFLDKNYFFSVVTNMDLTKHFLLVMLFLV